MDIIILEVYYLYKNVISRKNSHFLHPNFLPEQKFRQKCHFSHLFGLKRSILVWIFVPEKNWDEDSDYFFLKLHPYTNNILLKWWFPAKILKRTSNFTRTSAFLKFHAWGGDCLLYLFFNICSFLLCHYWNPTVSWFKHAPGTPNKCPMHEFSLELTVNT